MTNGTDITKEIDIQFIETDLYMSKELNIPYGARGVFGGQIIAQALNAAWDTVAEGFYIHSLHAYFVHPCNNQIPVFYTIQRIRDGNSFITRSVTATQNEKIIFTCSCSFTKIVKGATLEHQREMPQVEDPENLQTDLEVLEEALEKVPNPPKKFMRQVEAKRKEVGPIEYRRIYKEKAEDIVNGNVKPIKHDERWFKIRERLSNELRIHACCIAYASDSLFLNTTAMTHGYTYFSDSIGMMTSLNHVIWFYTPTRADEWLMFGKKSPRTYNELGTVFGYIYNQQGILVASTAQEGVLRLSKQEKEKRAML